jgi:hypothetical protein
MSGRGRAGTGPYPGRFRVRGLSIQHSTTRVYKWSPRNGNNTHVSPGRVFFKPLLANVKTCSEHGRGVPETRSHPRRGCGARPPRVWVRGCRSRCRSRCRWLPRPAPEPSTRPRRRVLVVPAVSGARLVHAYRNVFETLDVATRGGVVRRQIGTAVPFRPAPVWYVRTVCPGAGVRCPEPWPVSVYRMCSGTVSAAPAPCPRRCRLSRTAQPRDC